MVQPASELATSHARVTGILTVPTRILIAAIAMSALPGLAQTGAQSHGSLSGGKVVVQLEPLGQPRSLIQLIRASSLIIDGDISSVLPPVGNASTLHPPTVRTDSVVAVNSIFAGKVPNNSPFILLEQVGGKLGQWDITAAGDPLVSQGERYILFLQLDDRPNPPNASGMPRYNATGIWSGKAKVTIGRVQFLPQADASLHAFDGNDLNTFIQTLKKVIARPYTDADKQLPIQPPVKKQP
jgi:hypothetical protein